MKIYVVFIAARQVDGEYIVVRVEKAFKTEEKAKEYLHQIRPQYVGADNNSKVITINTPLGNVNCMAEVAVHEVVLEE